MGDGCSFRQWEVRTMGMNVKSRVRKKRGQEIERPKCRNDKAGKPQPNLVHSGRLPGFVWPSAVLELASSVSTRDQQAHPFSVSTSTPSATLFPGWWPHHIAAQDSCWWSLLTHWRLLLATARHQTVESQCRSQGFSESHHFCPVA